MNHVFKHNIACRISRLLVQRHFSKLVYDFNLHPILQQKEILHNSVCTRYIAVHTHNGENSSSKVSSPTICSKSDDCDKFGLLGGEEYLDYDGLQDDDGESKFLAKISDTGRPKPFDYLIKIERLLRPPVVDLKKALEILEVDMK